MHTAAEIPKILLSTMSYVEMQQHLRRIKRTRRRYISYALNGRTVLLARKEALIFVQVWLQRLET